MMNRHPVAANYYHVYQPHSYHDPALASLAYRPLQLPLQHPPELTLAGFHHNNIHQQTPRRQRHSQHQPRMALVQSDEELAELQKLSNDYQPDVTGPLVSERLSSSAIATQYELADPIYRQKTAALPQKYSHYRTTRGDGRCGWRAIAFGYFEGLLHLGDSNKFLEEETRLRSLVNVMTTAGYDAFLFEDMADETFDLLRKLASSLHASNADALLIEAFNNEELQNSVITHLKLLTCAWMKTRPQDYEAWLLPLSVAEYCDQHILPHGCEIEHVGITALSDVLLKPAGMALEILYLDLSPGSEANLHSFAPLLPDGQPMHVAATVRLLYRPGHYDLLYKQEDVPPEPIAVPTYLQYGSQPHQEHVFDLGVSDFMTMIPGMSYANTQHGWVSNPSYGTSDFFASPAPAQCQQPVPAAAPVYVAATPAHGPPPPPPPMHQDLVIRSLPPTNIARPGYSHQHPSDPFRSSALELNPEFVNATSHSLPFQTSIFRNSHFNTAHFLNPDFQPEEWSPDAEYVTTSNRGGRPKYCG